MVVITSDNRKVILDAVRGMYTSLANDPDGHFHFATGRGACEYVGYSDEELDPVPARALESFAGVAHPFRADVIREGDEVLDVGSGSGTDVLIASRLVGPGGSVIGLDMTRAMREKLEDIAEAAGIENVRTLEGSAEDIPLPDGSVSVVTSNGVLNLVPDKEKAAREIHRVLRPGGRIQISDIVVESPPSDACRAEPQLWAECIVGAVTLDQYLRTLRTAGFQDLEVVQEVDYFAASPSEDTREVAGSFGAHAVVIRGVKPAGSPD
ncbi:MAG: methyltransferase domain-containing protein [Gemmatimonadota bacterium]